MIVSDAVSWRVFLRALALELEQQAGADAAVTLLRGAGAQMGRMRSLPPVGSLEALAQEMNAVLGEMGWGRASLALDESAPCVVLTHTGLPQIGSAGDPPGSWLVPVLAGLFEAWMGQQPGADPALRAKLIELGESVVIHYGRF
jgi:hypothetical protein